MDKREIFRLTTVESTNDLALKALAGDGAHGNCWVAEAQTAGRGRRSGGGKRRRWHSPPGVNLYMSILLRPSISAQAAQTLTLAAGLAVCEVLGDLTSVEVRLKWPNDLYVADRKLGGILTEAICDASGLRGVVIGVGINCLLAVDQIPDELNGIVTSLLIEGESSIEPALLPELIRDQVLSRVETVQQCGFSSIVASLRRVDGTVGRSVEVSHNGEMRVGTASGIDDLGRLCVQFDDKSVLKMVSGEAKVLWGLRGAK